MSCWTSREPSTRLGQQVTIGKCSCCPPPCTCSTDPYTCLQGQALVQAIHDRKTNQGDQ